MLKILNFFRPNKLTHPTIDIYGHISSGVDKEQIQLLMKWLFDSLINAGYFGKSHLIFYNSNDSDRSLESVVKKVMRGDEPVFLYRCGGRVITLADGYYWRMMEEHPSMRIYQIEVKLEN